MALDMVDNALNKNEELHYHMGSNIFCTIKKDNVWTFVSTGNQ